MSVFAKKVSLLIAAAALLFAGCTKKPKRPDPSATMLGQGAGAGLNLSDVSTGDPLLTDMGSGLEQRGDGVYEDENIIRGLLQPVYFDFDRSAINAGERPKLQAAQDYLNKNPQHRLLLEGHCDWRGTAEYNLGLGDRRAGSARQFLQTLGVAANRLETSSKGDLEAVENADESTMARDRRVELIILKR
jgi:peptidoglycan-associated lipoprotein